MTERKAKTRQPGTRKSVTCCCLSFRMHTLVIRAGGAQYHQQSGALWKNTHTHTHTYIERKRDIWRTQSKTKKEHTYKQTDKQTGRQTEADLKCDVKTAAAVKTPGIFPLAMMIPAGSWQTRTCTDVTLTRTHVSQCTADEGQPCEARVKRHSNSRWAVAYWEYSIDRYWQRQTKEQFCLIMENLLQPIMQATYTPFLLVCNRICCVHKLPQSERRLLTTLFTCTQSNCCVFIHKLKVLCHCKLLQVCVVIVPLSPYDYTHTLDRHALWGSVEQETSVCMCCFAMW